MVSESVTYPTLEDTRVLVDKIRADPAKGDHVSFKLRVDTMIYKIHDHDKIPRGYLGGLSRNQFDNREWGVRQVHGIYRTQCIMKWSRVDSPNGVKQPRRIKRVPDAVEIRRAVEQAISMTADSAIFCDADSPVLMVSPSDDDPELNVAPVGWVGVGTVSEHCTKSDVKEVMRHVAEELTRLKEP